MQNTFARNIFGSVTNRNKNGEIILDNNIWKSHSDDF